MFRTWMLPLAMLASGPATAQAVVSPDVPVNGQDTAGLRKVGAEGRFGAQGIFGQTIRVDPKRKIVIVISAAAPKASDREYGKARTAFVDRLFAAAAAR